MLTPAFDSSMGTINKHVIYIFKSVWFHLFQLCQPLSISFKFSPTFFKIILISNNSTVLGPDLDPHFRPFFIYHFYWYLVNIIYRTQGGKIRCPKYSKCFHYHWKLSDTFFFQIGMIFVSWSIFHYFIIKSVLNN